MSRSDDVPLSPEKLAESASSFLKTEFGIEFMRVIKDQRDGYRRLAESFETSQEQKLAANERAAGIGEVIGFIDSQILYSEHPDYFDVIQKAPIDNKQ